MKSSAPIMLREQRPVVLVLGMRTRCYLCEREHTWPEMNMVPLANDRMVFCCDTCYGQPAKVV